MVPVVTALQALRGMAMVVAVTPVAEVGDLTRFSNPRDLMSHLRLVPSEYSSGATTLSVSLSMARALAECADITLIRHDTARRSARCDELSAELRATESQTPMPIVLLIVVITFLQAAIRRRLPALHGEPAHGAAVARQS
jgi:hypothetical protein